MTAKPSSVQRDEMFMLYQGLVRAIAWKTHQRCPRTVELDDLVAYGQIGLLEAITAFDAKRGRKFTTYAWHRIRGAMLDGLGKMAWFDRAAYEAGRYERTSAGVAPVAASPEPECGASSKGGVGAGPASDQKSPRRPARADLQEFHLLGREADACEATLHLELVMCLRDLLDALPEKEAALVRGTFFEGRTLTEAAKRVGISVAWASRLQTRTLADLRIALERGGFA